MWGPASLVGIRPTGGAYDGSVCRIKGCYKERCMLRQVVETSCPSPYGYEVGGCRRLQGGPCRDHWTFRGWIHPEHLHPLRPCIEAGIHERYCTKLYYGDPHDGRRLCVIDRHKELSMLEWASRTKAPRTPPFPGPVWNYSDAHVDAAVPFSDDEISFPVGRDGIGYYPNPERRLPWLLNRDLPERALSDFGCDQVHLTAGAAGWEAKVLGGGERNQSPDRGYCADHWGRGF